MLSLNSCLVAQIKSVNLGHKIRNARYSKVVKILLDSEISVSFPRIFKSQYDLKAFYRLMESDSVSHQDYLSGYRQGLQEYSLSDSGGSYWFLVQDTMMTDYQTRKEDFGYTQTINTNGIILHNGLLLDEKFIPLGLLHQEVIQRERTDFGKRYKFREKTIEQKESFKWLKGLQTGVEFSQVTGRKLVHIMDREADILDLINASWSSNQSFVIRARHDRSTLKNFTERQKVDNPEFYRLFYLMRESADKSIVKRDLKDGKGKTYRALCEVAFSSFTLRGLNQGITCVWLREIENPKVEWFVLTDLKVDTYQEAINILDIYTKRWIIEDFHKCYKTGCSIEKRQFHSAKTLTSVIAMLAIVAIKLLRSRFFAISHPDQPISEVVSDQKEVKFIHILAEQYLKPVDLTIAAKGTVLWWILLLGRMGGHQGFKQKGLPGWQSIWHGYQYYKTLWQGQNIKIQSE